MIIQWYISFCSETITQKGPYHMQNYTTIIGIIDMCQRGIPYDDCQARYGIGSSILQLIMKQFKECSNTLDSLKQMSPRQMDVNFFISILIHLHFSIFLSVSICSAGIVLLSQPAVSSYAIIISQAVGTAVLPFQIITDQWPKRFRKRVKTNYTEFLRKYGFL